MKWRILAEAVLVATAAAACVALVHSESWRACCADYGTIVEIVLVPATLLAIVVGGGVHNAPSVAFYVAAILEFTAVWGLVRLALFRSSRAA